MGLCSDQTLGLVILENQWEFCLKLSAGFREDKPTLVV